MKRIKVIPIIIAILLLFCGCDISFPERSEYPKVQSQVITATVVDVELRKWFAASSYHYEVTAEVYNDEYDITGTIQESGSGMFTTFDWNMQDGEEIDVIMYSWRNENGEVIKREITDFA